MMNGYATRLKFIGKTVVVLFAALIMTSCAITTQVVLLPDKEDKVSVLEVTDIEGEKTQRLDQAWQSVKTSPLTGVLGAPKVMDEKEVRAMFQHALAAQPPQPAVYILNFGSGRTSPTEVSLKLIPGILKAIKIRNSKNILIVGHTDTIGPAWYNLNLSLKRAKNVADILIEKGVPSENIEITSYGKEYPLVKRPDGVAEPKNRRVEITVR